MEACEECRAIRRELDERYAEIRRRALDPTRDLTSWIQQFDEEEAARFRERKPARCTVI